MGPISPGRWHVWQFFCNTGRTSLLKVTGAVATSAAITAVLSAPIPMKKRSIRHTSNWIERITLFRQRTVARRRVRSNGRGAARVLRNLPGPSLYPELRADRHELNNSPRLPASREAVNPLRLPACDRPSGTLARRLRREGPDALDSLAQHPALIVGI